MNGNTKFPVKNLEAQIAKMKQRADVRLPGYILNPQGEVVVSVDVGFMGRGRVFEWSIFYSSREEYRATTWEEVEEHLRDKFKELGK